MKILSTKPIYTALLLSSFLSGSAIAQPISTFTVLTVTSAKYNPVLPSNLTYDNAIYTLTWDPNTSWGQSKTSSWVHGSNPYYPYDTWLGFATLTIGQTQYSIPPVGNYNGSSATHWQDSVVYHDDYGNPVYQLDIFYGSFTHGGTFSATATSTDGTTWNASEIVQ